VVLGGSFPIGLPFFEAGLHRFPKNQGATSKF